MEKNDIDHTKHWNGELIVDMSDEHLISLVHYVDGKRREIEKNLGSLSLMAEELIFNINLEYVKRGLGNPEVVAERFASREVKDPKKINEIIEKMNHEPRGSRYRRNHGNDTRG